jgi:hypothetical protein
VCLMRLRNSPCCTPFTRLRAPTAHLIIARRRAALSEVGSRDEANQSRRMTIDAARKGIGSEAGGYWGRSAERRFSQHEAGCDYSCSWSLDSVFLAVRMISRSCLVRLPPVIWASEKPSLFNCLRMSSSDSQVPDSAS